MFVSPESRCPRPQSPFLRQRVIARFARALILVGLTGTALARADTLATLPPPPSELYGDLFVAVQTQQIFDDQKTFVDAVPNSTPATILQLYSQQKNQPNFDLKSFVLANFTLPTEPVITPPAGQTLREHIDWLWPKLTRTTTTAPPYSSLIPLPKPYVVPGGRFREGYYWDTYFTMLGLQESGREDLVDNMLDDFAYEIDQFGHIPNGNRTYYLSRSQPPFFAQMVTLAADKEGPRVYQKYLPQLRKEYAYWMRGETTTARGQAMRNVVVLPDGTVLNRYWDERDTPRDESYLEDVKTAQLVPSRPANEVYRDLRAAAESGWDFSSRWFGDNATLATIRTTSIVPVDLNSLLFGLELTIVKGCGVARDIGCVTEFIGRAKRRAEGINRYLWNRNGYYGDYDWQLGKPRDNISVAAVYPIFFGTAWPGRAERTLTAVRGALLKERGLATTTYQTGQQWDAPNGWAPLHWLAVESARRYGRADLARDIGTRFLADVKQVYASDQKLVEKYVVEGPNAGGGGGGEYPLQDGFGWTNGVTLKLLDLYAPGE
ncbi:alpha,alpha-trehalase TreA [Trinickia caryophylli]|uniref:Periplasmic trehalase n=1 Tax=Trinickia caryophylli TaxID=28094 RepID=A0A1X7CUP6_TRICW|nr:alpha,alpha-trehalase TreA [Trinickia caryophylli]PMS13382.1 alpha,alpha-trehalase TreA [Trinickia caryophylli]TRX13759.1 alpha,alpha-trehalase TreA [Trinickia caryophylli]WQE15352.1 alpha,alpha-trehalase TreA [Trinickia caryophylli]SMF03173.1 alpha,alpha-trehalase [Trinickia caryophylli]GLU30888.1 periplasmic trehalase [Trinickia caryophylli]